MKSIFYLVGLSSLLGAFVFFPNTFLVFFVNDIEPQQIIRHPFFWCIACDRLHLVDL